MSAEGYPIPGLVQEGTRVWTALELEHATMELAALLCGAGVRVLVSVLDNSAAWVVVDAAAARAGVVHVPIPVFFSDTQVQHVLHHTGADALMTSAAQSARWSEGQASQCSVAGRTLDLLRLDGATRAMPLGTTKITFTSGTTGTPKGVCLRSAEIQKVAQGLVLAMKPLEINRHLCVLPFAILLENIAGLSASMLNASTCVVAPLSELGLVGSSSFDAEVFHRALMRLLPDSIILLPQMLRLWVGYLSATGQRAPSSLKFVAVGGASVGAALLVAARALGIPAYEGYGLSEGASVQTLNLPWADLPGSAGRALPHARLRVSSTGEIQVAGSLFAGYLGDSACASEWWSSGDLGCIDAQGFLHVQGRLKNIQITSFGRNVSPEWIERALHEAGIGVAVVFGEGRPSFSAVIWPARPGIPDEALQACVSAANASLPDYAQVRHWVRASHAFDAASGMATANGRPQRSAILQAHAAALRSAEPSKPMEFL